METRKYLEEDVTRKKAVLNDVKKIIPGILLSFIIMFFGIYLADLLGVLLAKTGLLPAGSASLIFGIFIAIFMGVIIRNFIGVHPIFIDGIKFALKYALQIVLHPYHVFC